MEHFNEFHQCAGRQLGFDGRFVLKGTRPYYSPDRTFSSEHVKLEVKPDLKKQVLKSHATITLKALIDGVNEVEFDAVNFQIDKVLWNGEKAPYRYRKGKLAVRTRKKIDAGDEATVEVYYKVIKPKMGIFFLKPDRQYPKRPWQVWTQGQDEYARFWFPCFDSPGERITSEVIATVPKDFVAISNGHHIRTSHNKKEKTSTYHYIQKIAHAPYLVTLAVGKFKVIKDKWKNIPVLYYCEKGREADTKRAFGKTPKMLDFFSKMIGTSYPYPKYSQVAVSDFIYGGMENTSATTQTDSALLDKRSSIDYSSDELVAHELAHQWFGDYLTCKEWMHGWLNESFATYFDALFKRHDRGQDEFMYAIHQNSQEYFGEDREHYRRPIVTNMYKTPTDIFDRHLYEKGSVVLYMLHQKLGEKLFWKAIGHYVKKNKGKPVETTDLINAIQEATGRNMRQFFDQWVYNAGHPTYTIRYWWDSRKKEANLRIVQTNAHGGEKGLFTFNAEVLFKTKKGKRIETCMVNKGAHHYQFKLDSEPQMVVFDPNSKILKKMDFPRSESLLMAQLKECENPLARIEAAQALARKGNDDCIMALRNALNNDPFWGVQAEIALALGRVATEKTSMILFHSLDVVTEPKVRRAIYAALRSFKSQEIVKGIEKRYRREESYFAEANGLRALGVMNHPKAEDHLMKALGRDSWNDIIRTAALDGLGALKSTDHIPLFMKHTKYGHPHRVRMAAIRSLAQVEPGNTEVQNHLIELMQDGYLLVQFTAVRALTQMGDERAVPALKKMTTGDWDGRLKRMANEAIIKITKGF